MRWWQLGSSAGWKYNMWSISVKYPEMLSILTNANKFWGGEWHGHVLRESKFEREYHSNNDEKGDIIIDIRNRKENSSRHSMLAKKPNIEKCDGKPLRLFDAAVISEYNQYQLFASWKYRKCLEACSCSTFQRGDNVVKMYTQWRYKITWNRILSKSKYRICRQNTIKRRRCYRVSRQKYLLMSTERNVKPLAINVNYAEPNNNKYRRMGDLWSTRWAVLSARHYSYWKQHPQPGVNSNKKVSNYWSQRHRGNMWKYIKRCV